MPYRHAVVWLDHAKAHILHFNADASQADRLNAHPLHPHALAKPSEGHASENSRFYDDIAAALKDAQEVLVAGPGQEKLFFGKHLERHHPAVAGRVVGVETVDHPSDGQLLAFARKVFRKVDMMR